MKNYWLEREKCESLYVKVVVVSNVINRKTLQQCNWIVMQPEVAAIEDAPIGLPLWKIEGF